jgi:pyruvate oxidase
MLYICTICKYQYNEDVEMRKFEALINDWRCPICNSPKSEFKKYEIEYNDGDG